MVVRFIQLLHSVVRTADILTSLPSKLFGQEKLPYCFCLISICQYPVRNFFLLYEFILFYFITGNYFWHFEIVRKNGTILSSSYDIYYYPHYCFSDLVLIIRRQKLGEKYCICRCVSVKPPWVSKRLGQ